MPRDTGYTNDSKNCGLSGGDLAKAYGTWSWTMEALRTWRKGGQGGGLGEREVHVFHVDITCIDARSAST